jgi:hypothetical protein
MFAANRDSQVTPEMRMQVSLHAKAKVMQETCSRGRIMFKHYVSGSAGHLGSQPLGYQTRRGRLSTSSKSIPQNAP